MPEHRKILGIDIGATTIKYAMLTAGGGLSHRCTEKVASDSNAALITQLAAAIGRPEFAECTAVGIGSPGPLDLDHGIILSSANMPQIQNCRLLDGLKNSFPAKAFRLDNDANAATLGEKHFGAGKMLGDFGVFTLGTGVGGGCIFGGKLQRGQNGNFFEVGHVPVGYAANLTPRRCGCGNEGCLETLSSATGISASYLEYSDKQLTAAEIAEKAREGDSSAIRAYAIAGQGLGLAAATITQLMNLTDFVFTGGVAAAEALLRPELERTYKAHTFALFHNAKFIFTHGDEDAGILGAAALFLESTYNA